MLTAGLSVSAVAQQKFELGKPNNANYRYLDEYHALKEYIDYSKYPNFKLGVGTTVNEYLNNSLVRDLTNKNFTETVAGNAMKMASCVDGNGNMNFTTVKNYVKKATEAGLNVYGHTLAWHSQQPNGWLRKLLADKAAPDLTDGDVEIVTVAASKDFRKTQSVGWKDDETKYGFKITFDATDGLHVNATKSCEYQVQFVGMSDLILTKGKTYKMTMTVKGSKAGNVTGRLGDWGTGAGINVPFTTEWKDVEINIKPTMVSNFMLLQLKNFIGEVYIKSIKFESKTKGKTTTEERRCLKAHATERQKDAWDNQMWLVPGSFSSGASYVFTAKVRADKPAYASTQVHKTPGSFAGNGIGNINFTTEWKTITLSGKFSSAGQSIAINLNELADENNYYFDDVSLKIGGVEKIKNGNFEGTDVSSFQVKEYGGTAAEPTISNSITYVYVPSTTPLTQQERHDTLVYAMDKWIKGMMEACGGKVKA